MSNFVIVETVPYHCCECEHYSEYGDTGCHHPEKNGCEPNDNDEEPPPDECPVRLGWPRHYKQVPENFPEYFEPRVAELYPKTTAVKDRAEELGLPHEDAQS